MQTTLKISLVIAAVVAGLVTGWGINSAQAITEATEEEARNIYGADCWIDQNDSLQCGQPCDPVFGDVHAVAQQGGWDYHSPYCPGTGCMIRYVDLKCGCSGACAGGGGG